MNSTIASDRRAAVKSATASSALSSFVPSQYGMSVYGNLQASCRLNTVFTLLF